MFRRILKRLLSFLLTVFLATLVMLAVRAATDGMWLFGIPSAKDVASVTLTDTEFPGAAPEYTDAESIERTLKLTSFLKYRLFTAASEDDAPVISIVWTLRDGTGKVLAEEVDMHNSWISDGYLESVIAVEDVEDDQHTVIEPRHCTTRILRLSDGKCVFRYAAVAAEFVDRD